jgi:aspartate aminotransferase
MKLSRRIDNFQPSAIAAVFDLAVRLRAEGRDIVDLSTGEPDFKTDAHVISAAHQAIDAGVTRYTECDGTQDLKQAICRKLERDNNLSYTEDEIVVGSGAKPLLGQLFMTLLDPGDEVIIPSPCWTSHVGMTEALDAVPVVVETQMHEEFKLQPQTLARVLTPKTKMLVLCSPSNPTGAVYSHHELEALAQVLREHPDVWIVSDDIYEKIIFDGRAFCTMAEVAPDLKHRTLTINGVSKCYAMTGWRIGYAAGDSSVMAGLRNLMSQVNGSPCSISQVAAIAALEGPEDAVLERQDVYQQRRDNLISRLSLVDGLAMTVPQGAFYLLVNCQGMLGRRTPAGEIIQTSEDFTRFLLESASVAVVPGKAFYAEPYFRISFATSNAELDSACERIAAACEELR